MFQLNAKNIPAAHEKVSIVDLREGLVVRDQNGDIYLVGTYGNSPILCPISEKREIHMPGIIPELGQFVDLIVPKLLGLKGKPKVVDGPLRRRLGIASSGTAVIASSQPV